MRTDAHHHLWRYNAHEYDWITEDLGVLRRDYLAVDLQRVLEDAGMQGAVAVQARQTLVETEWLLENAKEAPLIQGVVGWLPLCEPNLEAVLERFLHNPFFKGVRHVLQAEPAGFMDRTAFREGLKQIALSGLTYDVLIFESQIQEATRLADDFPNLSFVLDHIAKPRIGRGNFAEWALAISEFALRPNVVCKLSGVVTEAEPGLVASPSLRPYYEVVLEAFTPSRLLFGSDWPVVLTRCGYADWLQMVTEWTAELSASEQAAIFGDNAVRVYQLGRPDAHGVQGENR